jgi:geranylgeranylglycerol-phosphate geranylgeranyltransferase
MNFSKKTFAFIKITRPINVLITFLVVIVAILIAGKEQTELIVIILVPLAAALIAAAGNIVNDIYDIETDRISHPNRILVLESLSIKEVWIEYWTLNLVSVFIAIYLSPILLIIVLITIFLLYIYSAFLKRLPLIGNIIIASITALAFIYGGYAVENPKAAIIPAVFAFLINLIREIVKDIQDIEGDLKLNYKTFPIRLGLDASKHLIVLITIVLILSTLYPFILQIYKIEYFILVMVFVNPVLVICIKILLEKRRQADLKMISRLLKLNMLVGLIAIFLGR